MHLTKLREETARGYKLEPEAMMGELLVAQIVCGGFLDRDDVEDSDAITRPIRAAFHKQLTADGACNAVKQWLDGRPPHPDLPALCSPESKHLWNHPLDWLGNIRPLLWGREARSSCGQWMLARARRYCWEIEAALTEARQVDSKISNGDSLPAAEVHKLRRKVRSLHGRARGAVSALLSFSTACYNLDRICDGSMLGAVSPQASAAFKRMADLAKEQDAFDTLTSEEEPPPVMFFFGLSSPKDLKLALQAADLKDELERSIEQRYIIFAEALIAVANLDARCRCLWSKQVQIQEKLRECTAADSPDVLLLSGRLLVTRRSHQFFSRALGSILTEFDTPFADLERAAKDYSWLL